MMLPSRFQRNGTFRYEPDPGLAGRRIRLRFLDRSLRAASALMEEFLFSERYSQVDGLLQKIDPRVKLITLLLWVVLVSLLHFPLWILGLYGVSLGLAFLSKVPLAFFVRRVWLVLPLFAGVVALPATLNLFTPGESAVVLFSLSREYRWGPYRIPSDIGLTWPGIHAALLLVIRVGTAMSFVLLLTLTTPWPNLLKALRSLRVPAIYVHTLGMTLRYLFLFAQLIQDTHLAKRSRTLRSRGTKAEQRWVAGQMGALFQRSLSLSAEVHRAMVARGYQGEVRILSPFHLHPADGFWAGACAGLMIFFLWAGR